MDFGSSVQIADTFEERQFRRCDGRDNEAVVGRNYRKRGMNVSELKVKPCPFCGSDDISFSAFSLSPDAYALCGHCNAGIEIQVGWDEMTEKEHDEVCNLELQKVWNRRAADQPQLNENQQAVLEWLKWKRHEGSQPIECLSALAFGNAIKLAIIAYINLKDTQQFQVLAAFAEWGMEQEEE